MISEIYNKNISIFIFNENIYLARAIKDRLVASQYEVHFYTDEHLLRQSVYLALPHIVIVPSTQKHEQLVFDIRKMSREIQIVVLAPEEDYEAVLSLKRKGFINDFIIDPLKYLDSIPYRVDLACERWILMSQLEENSPILNSERTAEVRDELFQSGIPQVDLSQDSVLSSVLSSETDVSAIKTALEKMSALVGKGFIFLEYDPSRELLALKDVSFGMRKELEGLGISLENIGPFTDFFSRPFEHKIFRDFLMQVFSVDDAQAFTLKQGDDVFGFLVSLTPIHQEHSILFERVAQAVSLKIDNAKKTRMIHNHLQVDRDYECFSNKYFYGQISDEISRAHRLSLPLTLIIFDLTSTPSSNLRHSSSVVCKVLKRFTRCTDLVGRTGTARFGVLLPHCSLESGISKARKLQTILRAALIENKQKDTVVKAGVTAYPDQQSDAMSLLDAAEKACLQADGFDVCVIEMSESKGGLRDRIKDRIKGASL